MPGSNSKAPELVGDEAPDVPAKPRKQKDLTKAPLWANQQFGLLLLLIGLLTLFRVLRPVFFHQDLILFPLVRDICLFTIVGFAQMVVLSIGQMNLAVGRMAAFSAMVMGIGFDVLHLPLVIGAMLGLIAGAGIGTLVGWIIVRTGVTAFVVTLSLDFALLGLIPVVYTATTDNAAYTTKPAGMETFRTGSLADISIFGVSGPKIVPHMVWLTVVAVMIVWYIYRRTRLGREILLTGANPIAAELSGVPTGRRIIFVHAMSGTLAGLAGLMSAMITGSIKASVGSGFMLPSFVGPILGGTPLTGGFVSIVGTVIGSSIMLVIRKGLDVMGVGLEYLNIWLGAILLVAISTDRVRSFLHGRRGEQS